MNSKSIILAIISCVSCSHSMRTGLWASQIPATLCVSGASNAINGEYTYGGTSASVTDSNLDGHYWQTSLAEDCKFSNFNSNKVFIRTSLGHYEISYENQDGCHYALCVDPIDAEHATPDTCSNWDGANSWNAKVEAGPCPSVQCNSNIFMEEGEGSLNGEPHSEFDRYFVKVAENIYKKIGAEHYWAYNQKLGVWKFSTRSDGKLPEINYCLSGGYQISMDQWDGVSYDFPIEFEDTWPSATAVWSGCDKPMRRRRLLNY